MHLHLPSDFGSVGNNTGNGFFIYLVLVLSQIKCPAFQTKWTSFQMLSLNGQLVRKCVRDGRMDLIVTRVS